MRLYNIYYLCKQCEETINGLSIPMVKGSQTRMIENWEEYKKALSVIRQIDFLKEDVDDLYEAVPVFVREKARPQIDSDTYSKLVNKKALIVTKMQAIIELYESMNLGEELSGIDVKVPKCESLDEYISILREIDFIFTQCPYMRHKDVQIKFNTVDVGSQWLSFLIYASAGTAAVKFIWDNLAAMIDVSLRLKSHLVSVKRDEEILRQQELQGDVLQSILEGFDMLKKHHISMAVSEMEKKNEECPLEDGEDRGRLEKSIEKLCNLLDKGVEIYASIDTPKETQLLFPSLGDKAELPDNVLRFLEDKNEG